MKHRPTNVVRVLGACARCGGRPAAYHVRRVDEFLDVAGKLVRHQLIVCADCDRWHADEPTAMELGALGRDAADPIQAQEFAQRWMTDVARVQRTARLFLGAERCGALALALLAERAKRDAETEAWRASSRRYEWADLEGRADA